jgi:hypothetical protein
MSNKRFWMAWWGGSDDDCRPPIGSTIPWPPEFEWWCYKDRRGENPPFAMCGVIDAENQEAAWKILIRFWPEATLIFIEEKGTDWIPRKMAPFLPSRWNRSGENE